jgi:hypothetical protein
MTGQCLDLGHTNEQMNVIGHDHVAIHQDMSFSGAIAKHAKGGVNGVVRQELPPCLGAEGNEEDGILAI